MFRFDLSALEIVHGRVIVLFYQSTVAGAARAYDLVKESLGEYGAKVEDSIMSDCDAIVWIHAGDQQPYCYTITGPMDANGQITSKIERESGPFDLTQNVLMGICEFLKGSSDS